MCVCQLPLFAGATKHGVDLDRGDFVIGPELEDVSSSTARQAIIVGDFATAEQYLHPDVVAWHKKKKFSYVVKKLKTNKRSAKKEATTKAELI